MKKIIIFSLLFFFTTAKVLADYVLPYPSYMPGHKLYYFSRVLDKVKVWWYWGDIAKIKYSLQLSDKYLVEAKTLFDYKQYLLAVDALNRSSTEAQRLPVLLQSAVQNGKNVTNLRTLVRAAMQTHINVLENLRKQLPNEFLWQPEKGNPTNIAMGRLLDDSLNVRMLVLNSHVEE